MKRSRILAAAVATSTLVALAGCSSSGSNDGKTIKVAYQDFGSDLMSVFMNKAKKDFEAANPGENVKLVPIEADENDYYTKLALMNRRGDRARRHLRGHVPDPLRRAGRLPAAARRLRRPSGPTGPSSSTTPRRRARATTARPTASRWAPTPAASATTRTSSPRPACPTDWQPKNWDDILAAAEDDQGEGARRHPAQRLRRQGRRRGHHHAGLRDAALRHDKDALYDADTRSGSPARRASPTRSTSQDRLPGRLGPAARSPATPRSATTSPPSCCPRASSPSPSTARGCPAAGSPAAQRVARAGTRRWATPRCRRRTATPPGTSHVGRLDALGGRQQQGQGDGVRLHRLRAEQGELVNYDTENSQIAVRKDVAEDPAYVKYNPSFEFFSSLVP